jgi:REP element-mobilizing transposase RayT
MSQLTAKQLEDKLRFAGEVIPSMKRRCDGHDYEARQMYLITITVEGRRPLLGRVIGNPEAEEGAPDAPHIELSPLGKEVGQEWMAIPQYHPEVKVLALQIMPDHLHSILFVKERMPQHLGHIIKGFKASTNKVYRRLIEPRPDSLPVGCDAVATNETTVATNAPALRPHPDRKHGLLWSIGYTDGILGRKGQLDNWFTYLRDNPRRLLMKRLHPEFFRVQRNVKVGIYEFSAIGNRYLLTHPVRLQVQCSRRLTETEIAQQKAYYLEQAKRGAVLVSPSISPGEKTIMRAAFDAGCPLILLQENGFTDLAKPGGARFDACAEGRLLILAPWEHHNQRLTIQRNQCLSLNEMVRVICE